MVQIFFLTTTPDTITQALSGITGQRIHIWNPTGGTTFVGVVEIITADENRVANALIAANVSLLPSCDSSDVISADQVTALQSYGVVSTDTTEDAMTKVFAASGFPHHKVSQY